MERRSDPRPCGPAGANAHPAGTVRVEVVYAPAGAQVDQSAVELPLGATIEQALLASGVLERHGPDTAQLPVGVWGRRARLDTPLREGDRVELYRPLQCDPKESRRLRHRRQRPASARAYPRG